MKDYTWPVPIVLSAIIACLSFENYNTPEKCEKLCSPRGVHVYVDSGGRCECEPFVGAK